jgi:hypothetical protein
MTSEDSLRRAACNGEVQGNERGYTAFPAYPFSKEMVFTPAFCHCDPSFPAFFFAVFSRHLSRYSPLMDRPVVLGWVCADDL